LEDHILNKSSDNAAELDPQSLKKNNILELSTPLKPLIKNINSNQSNKQK